LTRAEGLFVGVAFRFFRLNRLNRGTHFHPACEEFTGHKFQLLDLSQGFNVATYLFMSNAAKDSSSANDLLKNSSLYREFQAEREEILRHKWIESEKAGRDIGFEQALTDWIIKHRSTWRRNRHDSVKN
jgi:hypothetical protein